MIFPVCAKETLPPSFVHSICKKTLLLGLFGIKVYKDILGFRFSVISVLVNTIYYETDIFACMRISIYLYLDMCNIYLSMILCKLIRYSYVFFIYFARLYKSTVFELRNFRIAMTLLISIFLLFCRELDRLLRLK